MKEWKIELPRKACYNYKTILGCESCYYYFNSVENKGAIIHCNYNNCPIKAPQQGVQANYCETCSCPDGYNINSAGYCSICGGKKIAYEERLEELKNKSSINPH